MKQPGPYNPKYFGGQKRSKKDTIPSEDRPWHWTRTIMLIGLFGSLFTLATAGSWTVVTKIYLSKGLALFCVAGLLLPFKWYARFLGISRVEALMFNVLGVGPILFASLLWVNFLFHGPVQEQTFKVVEKKMDSTLLDSAVIFQLEDDKFRKHQVFRTFVVEPDPDDLDLLKARYIHYKVATGALGYEVVLEKEAKL